MELNFPEWNWSEAYELNGNTLTWMNGLNGGHRVFFFPRLLRDESDRMFIHLFLGTFLTIAAFGLPVPLLRMLRENLCCVPQMDYSSTLLRALRSTRDCISGFIAALHLLLYLSPVRSTLCCEILHPHLWIYWLFFRAVSVDDEEEEGLWCTGHDAQQHWWR